MRPALLLAAAGAFAIVGAALSVHAPMPAAIAATETPDGVHATTEADLAQLRAARPTLDGPVLVGLRLRWCVDQGSCHHEDK